MLAADVEPSALFLRVRADRQGRLQDHKHGIGVMGDRFLAEAHQQHCIK